MKVNEAECCTHVRRMKVNDILFAIRLSVAHRNVFH